MRRAELRDELERLGSRPVPLPDPRRVDAIEDRLYQEFVVTPASSGAALLAARRRRRVVLVGGLGAAAAATFAALVLHRGSTPGFELQAASGAVALFPDGASRPVHAGDQIPPGGLIQTGPSGAVTIEGTKIGPDQVVLLSDEGLTLLPSHSTTDQAATEVPPSPTPSPPPPSTAAPEATAPPEASVATAPAPVADPLPSSPVVPPADPVVAATTVPETSAAPAPAVFTQPIDHLELTVGEDTGGVSLAWTPSDAADFGRYVVARGTAAEHQLGDIAELGDRQITSFTDPAAPHGVAVMYRVVAMSEDGRPLAASDVVELTLEDGSASSAPTTAAPPTTDGTGTGLTVPPTTGPGSTSVPSTTAPATTSPSTSEPATTGGAASTTTAPVLTTTSAPTTTSGRVNGPATTNSPAPTTTSGPATTPGTEPAPSGPPTATTRPGG